MEAASDDALLDRTKRAAFGYFLEHCNPANGLVADTESEGAPASIAVVGFALASYVVGLERGWISRQDAVERTRSALRFFARSEQGRHRRDQDRLPASHRLPAVAARQGRVRGRAREVGRSRNKALLSYSK